MFFVTRAMAPLLAGLMSASIALADINVIGRIRQQVLVGNPTVAMSRVDMQIAQESIQEERSSRLPTLSLSSNQVIEKDGKLESQLEARQRLWTFGKIETPIQIAEAEFRQASAQYHETVEAELLKALQIYIDLGNASHRLEIELANLSELRELHTRIARRAGAGMASTADLNLATSRLTQAEIETQQVETEIAQLEIAYAQIVQSDYVNLGALLPLSKTPPVDELDDPRIDDNPTLQRIQYDVMLSALAEKNANAQLMPDISLRAQSLWNDDSIAEDTRVLLTLESNLEGLGVAALSRTRQARLASDRARSDVARIRQEIFRKLRTLQKQISTNRALQGQLLATIESLALTQQSYERQVDANRKTWLEVLNMQREVTQQRRSMARLAGDTLRSEYEWKALVGRLSAL